MVDTRGRERYFPTKWTILSRQILQLNSGVAEVFGTTMVTLVIVFPESSDKGEFYNQDIILFHVVEFQTFRVTCEIFLPGNIVFQTILQQCVNFSNIIQKVGGNARYL